MPRGAHPTPFVESLSTAAEAVIPGPGPVHAASAEETECILRWLESPGVRLVEVDGEWSLPVHGAARHKARIDLAYRAAKAGWERWLVPSAVVHHDYAAVIDKRFLSRHTLWHLRGMARFLRKHPERLLALR